MSPMESFSARVLASQAESLYLITGFDYSRKEAWYYVKVHHGKEKGLEKAFESGSFDIRDFADILVSGYGKNPPKEIDKAVRERFNLPAE